MIPALVLTAGVGSRLDPLTRLVAKAAVPLDDRSLVEHVLSWLSGQGIEHAVLNLHHRPASITRLVADGRHLGLSVRYSWEPTLLGSAGGPRRALPLLSSDSFLIVNGDTLCHVDLRAMLAQHAESGALVTMALVPNRAPHHYNGVCLNERNEVVGFVHKGPEAQGSQHFIGVQIARASVFARLEDGRPAETVWGLYRDLVASEPGRVLGFPIDTDFIDVGTPSDYLEAALRLRKQTGGDSGARLSSSLVWPGASVDETAELDRCIVAGGVHVPGGFTASSRIILPASVAAKTDAIAIRGDMALFPLAH